MWKRGRRVKVPAEKSSNIVGELGKSSGSENAVLPEKRGRTRSNLVQGEKCGL